MLTYLKSKFKYDRFFSSPDKHHPEPDNHPRPAPEESKPLLKPKIKLVQSLNPKATLFEPLAKTLALNKSLLKPSTLHASSIDTGGLRDSIVTQQPVKTTGNYIERLSVAGASQLN